MTLTAWAEEQQAKHNAWREIDELKRQNAALVAERDALVAQIPEIRAEAVEKAANLLRFAPVDGGQKWAVRYVDLLEYAERVKRGEA